MKHILDIGKVPDRQRFVAWLQAQGHTVNWPNRPTARTFVNGYDILFDMDAQKTYLKLWDKFLASKEAL